MTSKKDSLRERAALYALGALSAEETRAFEAELGTGHAETEAELTAFQAVVEDLAYAAAPRTPPAALRGRVLERIGGDDVPVFERGGLYFARGDRLGWQPGRAAGVEVKTLALDAERGRRTVLVRMAPGTLYPAHRHDDLEEIYMLEGDYLVSGVLMQAGDYCRAEVGTLHEDGRTVGGCVFIVTASLHDQPTV